MLPKNLILVRHGQSEGNVAQHASRRGDNQFFTPEFRERHSSSFHLTEKGIIQATYAGLWLRKNIPFPLGRFYVSDYVRAMETAAYLELAGAGWRREFHLRERDMALMDNITEEEKRERYALEVEEWEKHSFFSTPAGGGESVAQLCMRLKTTMLTHWARECPNDNVIVVCHGRVIRGFQVEIEGLLPEDFLRLINSKQPWDKMRNGQIVWYTRFDPWTGEEHPHIVAVRIVCPWDLIGGDYGWRRIERKTWSNEELLSEAAKR